MDERGTLGVTSARKPISGHQSQSAPITDRRTWSDEREEAGEKDGARRLHQRPVERPRVERLMQEGEGGGERRRILVANRRSRDEEERGVQDGDADPVQGDGKHGRGLLRCASIPIRAQDGWVGGQEADARGSVQGWEAVAGTEGLEACHTRSHAHV